MPPLATNAPNSDNRRRLPCQNKFTMITYKRRIRAKPCQNKFTMITYKRRTRARPILLCSNNEAQEQDSGRLMSKLPSEILLNILSRLPVKTIIHIKCVCKNWRDILSSPYFANQHAAMAPASLLLSTGSNRSTPMPKNFFMYDINAGSALAPDSVLRFNTKFNLPKMHVQVVGSCNGLLCLLEIYSRYSFIYTLHVCNPITGEYLTLPEPKVKPKEEVGCKQMYEFGFSSQSNQYKVIRIIERSIDQPSTDSPVHRAEVYTLGTNSWRSIGDTPFSVFYCEQSPSVPLNGALHRIVEGNNDSNYIYAFDIEDEQFRSIPPPPLEVPMEETDDVFLGVLGSFLSIYDRSSYHKLDIWMMKDYGVKNSWTKEYVIDEAKLYLTPIEVQEDGSILMSEHYKGLGLYNPRCKCFKYLEINDTKNTFEAILHTANFLSLKDVLGGECSTILNVRSR